MKFKKVEPLPERRPVVMAPPPPPEPVRTISTAAPKPKTEEEELEIPAFIRKKMM